MTTLPIDYQTRPWKHKYLDEETPELNFWFILGERENGNVDINDPRGEVMINVPHEAADEIIKARSSFIDVVLKHFG